MSVFSLRALLPLASAVMTALLCSAPPTQMPAAQAGHTYTCHREITEQSVPSQTIRFPTNQLPEGEEQLLCEGCDGLIRETCDITLADGRELSRSVIRRQTLVQKKDRIILYGLSHSLTQAVEEPDNCVRTASGERLPYNRALSVIATAYSCEGRVGTTAIGTTARVGAIAVDPNIIPYGTRMYIASDDGEYIYGVATAEDCGNFRGYQIDLYFDTVDECFQFGSRRCTVYILD